MKTFLKTSILQYLSLFTLIAFFACSSGGKNVDMLVYNAELGDNVLKINGDTIKLSSAQFTTIRLKQGVQHIESGGVYPDSVRLVEESLLTSGVNRFAKIPMYFGERNAINSKINPYPVGPILLQDSLLLWDPAQFATQEKLIARLKKDNAKAEANKRYDHSFIELVPNSNGLILRDWNYDLGSMPESISVDSDASFVTRSVLIDFSMLRVYAMLEEDFTVETIAKEEDRITVMKYIAGRQAAY